MLLAIEFRLLPKYGVTNLHAIVVNYFTCFVVGSIVNGQSPLNRGIVDTEWFSYALFLSLTFIVFFNVNAYSTQKVGMIITGVFQKLSLLFPVLAGWMIFGETATTLKIIAILLAVVSIILINIPSGSNEESKLNVKQYWYLPLIVLFGSGLIEVTLFYTEQTGKVTNAGVDFVTILFFMAGCIGLTFMTVTGRILKVTRRDVIAGVFIGIPNFFTIYLLIRGLELGWDGSVLFPLNNIGVIFFTAIVGMIFFKEKLSNLNRLGLGLAFIVVYLISV